MFLTYIKKFKRKKLKRIDGSTQQPAFQIKIFNEAFYRDLFLN